MALGVLGGLVLTELVIQLQTAGGDVGQDFRFYRAAGERWVASGALYLPHQLAGPYELALMVDMLYPPVALLLFVPMSVLPSIVAVFVWWGIPAAVIGATTRRHAWVWLVVLLWPRAMGAFVYGNTDMWAAASVAAGLRWGWPAALLLLKPVFAPLAVVGMSRRSLWLAIGFLALSVVVAAPLWLDYVASMQNMRGLELGYSLPAVPLIVAPMLVGDPASWRRLHAIIGRRDGPPRAGRYGQAPAGSPYD